MFNNVNFNNLSNFSIDELENSVSKIVNHIENHLDFKVEQSCLVLLNQTMSNHLTLEVLDGLRKITQIVIEKGLYENQKVNLKVIANLCKEIIIVHPNFLVDENFSPEMLYEVISFINPNELGNINTVSTSWKEATSYNQLIAIKEGKLKLSETLKGYTASEAVNWVSNYGKNIEYADFEGFENFDDACLEKLLKECPHIKHLSIPHAKIHTLQHLQHTTNLQSLNISGCLYLDADALKHLQYTPLLQSLDITRCLMLEPNALKHLQYTPKLQNLSFNNCFQFVPDALKYLQYTRQLQSLNILGSIQIEHDALKHLYYTPNLNSLNIANCVLIDALDHLELTPNLQYLNISHCIQIPQGALKCLEYTPQLLSLNIEKCSLERDALKHLEYTPQLQDLNIAWCCLEQDVLKNLQHAPHLQSLNISGCKLEPSALQHLLYIPELLNLVMEQCNELEEDALKHLQSTPQLQSLNIAWCQQLEPSALKELQFTPQLESLDMRNCNQLEQEAFKLTLKLKNLNIRYCYLFDTRLLPKHVKLQLN